MHTHHSSLLTRAGHWLSSSLFNTDRPGEYFEYLLEGLNPTWSATECKARVVAVQQETHDTRSWLLQPNRSWRGFRAGQHIQITVVINGVRHSRTFTLSSAPAQWQQQGTISITVKQVANGRVTGWMHEHLNPGAVISISQAVGDFVMPETENNGTVGYLAAGSGITPVMSHLRQQTAVANHNSRLLYFARTSDDFIFGQELQHLSRDSGLQVQLIASQGPEQTPNRLGSSHIAALLESKPQRIFICGPYGFRELAKQLLASAGYPSDRIHEEAFGLPPQIITADGPVAVRFSASSTDLISSKPDTLLNLAEQSGLKPNSGCRMGICYTCTCRKTSGQVRNLISGELSGNGVEDIRICISTPVTDVTLDL